MVGRAAGKNPANRFESVHLQPMQIESWDEDPEARSAKVPTQWFVDRSQTLIRENQSEDIPFRYSMNPYRGCEHGCAYCYARPTHETLGLGAGLDFESKILVKQQAAKLLRRELCRAGWQSEPITLSGVTDCYQPIERGLKVTRSLLEVLVEARQAFAIITKNALVLRDIDLIQQAHAWNGVHVFLSVTSLRQELTKQLEPRTSAPAARLDAVRRLSALGIPVGVMVAPVIPGLNDEEVPAILKAAADAGAQSAAYILLRLPLSVQPVFVDWLDENVPPEHARRVLSRIEDCRQGRLNDSQWGVRMRGTGSYAEAIAATFQTFARKFNLDRRLPELSCHEFRPPIDANGQKFMF